MHQVVLLFLSLPLAVCLLEIVEQRLRIASRLTLSSMGWCLS